MTSGVRSKSGAAGPTVSAGWAKALLAFAVSKGADAQGLLEHAGLARDDLADVDGRISFEKYKALMRAGKVLTGDPALALHFGAEARFVELSIVGLIAHASETMAEAFAQTNRYARLVMEVDGAGAGDRFAIERANGEVWLTDQRLDPNSFPELTESTWARFVCEHARGYATAPFAKAVHVTHAAPAHRAEYDRIFKMPVIFESDKNALLIEESWLSLRIAPANRYAFGVFSQHAQALLKSLETAQSTRGQVEALLIPILHTGALGMDMAAEKLGLSQPSLYRKLKDEGVSYETVLDALRHKMALHYLDGKKVSVNQAAYLVGF